MLLTRDAAAAKIKRSRTPGIAKLATATTVRLDEATGDFIVRYHDTDIVHIRSNGYYQLFAGDWQTHMTKERINEYTGARVYTEAGFWYIGDTVFRDGMIVHDGELLPEFVMKPEELETFKVKARALDRAIKRYCRGYVDACVANRTLFQPGPGDCFMCSMVPVDKSKVELEFMGFGHLIDHMVENYYVGSLLLRALRERNNAAAWQSDTQKMTPEERFKAADDKARKDGGYLQYDLSHGREGWFFYKTLRRYFARRKFRLVEEFDPVDFKKRYAEAREDEKAAE